MTINISNSSYEPLHQGTEATVRLTSLSGIANRYIDLRLGPGNAPTIPSGGVDRHRRHDQRGRHRRAVQHAQPADAEGAPEPDPGRRLAVRGQGRGGAGGVGVSEPGGRVEQHPVPGAQPRQRRRLHELRRPVVEAALDDRREVLDAHGAGQEPRDDHRGACLAEERARPVDPGPPAVHGARGHDVREPPQLAGRADAAGQRLKAGGPEAPEVPRPARAAGQERGPDRPRPGQHHLLTRVQALLGGHPGAERPDPAARAERAARERHLRHEPTRRAPATGRSRPTARSGWARSRSRRPRSTTRPPSSPPPARTRST